MEDSSLIWTIVVGFGLLACGFFAGRNYWSLQTTHHCLETLIRNNYVKYHMVNNEPQLIKLDKYTLRD